MHQYYRISRSFFPALILLFVLVLISGCKESTHKYESVPWVLITADDSKEEIINKASLVTPSTRQLEWQKKEFLAFIHFGSGRQTPETFDPKEFDADQWVEVCKNTGMKMLILTTKHHVGFCLWPSKYTDYSVERSPWKDGKGDMVKEVADACKRAGLEFGVYVSPWDRAESTYGTPAYDEFFKNQLRELLTNYGPIAEVWFDGHYGGPEGGRQDYKWDEYYGLIRELQPDAVIAIKGPDARWVGNEKGYARESEWSVLPMAPSIKVNIEEGKEINIDQHFPYLHSERAEDLGSREKLHAMEPPYFLVWYPAETDVSFRPSWSFRPDEQPHSLEKLLDIYYESIGRNSVLLLNYTPDYRGLIPEEDVQRAKEFRKVLDATFNDNLLERAKVKTSENRKGHKGEAIVDNDTDSYWMTSEGNNKATIEFELAGEKLFNRFLVQEFIQSGQRIEAFSIQSWDGQKWIDIADGTTVGYKRILRFDDVISEKVRLTITSSRGCPTITNCGLYYQPLVEDILSSN